MRSLRKSWIGIVLVILFTASLFFWRQSSFISNIFNSDNIIAKVGNTPISTTRFNRALRLNINQFNEILGKDLSGEEIKKFQIPQLALGAIVNETVFENEFDNLNFKLDKTIIAKKSKETIPQLYNSNNDLDENYLQQFLSNQGLKIDDIVQIFHYDARNEYFNSIILNIKFPNSFTQKIENYNHHKRDIEYLNFPIKSININKELKDNENNLDSILLEYYNKNISQYMSDEKRNIEYINIDKNDFLKTFIPSENEVKEYYNNNSDLYLNNEERSFLQFNFKTIKEAENFKKRIINISSYNDIKTYAKKENIEFNIFDNLSKNEILDEIGQSLFSLNINEQSSIIKTPVAYHIVILKSIKRERQLSFEESKDDIIKTISNIDVNNFIGDLENQISQDILEGFNLKEIAKKNNLKVSIINEITSKFNNSKNDKKFYNSIIENAFNANLNFINDIVEIDEDKSYIYEVVKIVKSQPLEFISIKNNVLEDWKKFIKIEKIDLLIKNNSKNFDFLKDLERQFQSKINNLSISFSNNELPKNLITDIFNSEPNSISFTVFENKIHLSKLLKINIDRKSDLINENISLNEEIRNALYNELIKKTKISTNDQMINAVVDSY